MKIKICGITNLDDARQAADLGADALGFNFYRKSPRYIDPESAAEIARQIREEVERVGVFVNEEPAEIARIASEVNLDLVQLHGDETPDIVREVRDRTGIGVIKALRTEGPVDLADAAAFRSDALLLDSLSIEEYGGTGTTFDWQNAAGVFETFDRVYLAGGLSPSNVADAVTKLKPYGIDVCSGVESAPGRKDLRKMEEFVKTVRNAEAAGLVSDRNEFEPDEYGYFGEFGGRFVPETLVAALDELTEAYEEASASSAFADELNSLFRDYSGRPTSLFHAARLTEYCGGAKIYLKREDLNHTGAHKINNAIGQALLARRMGKKRIIAETGAGQHGVATATVCALFGLECVIYMGTEDMRRQALNVYRMELLGAEVRGVDSGSRTLKDAINEALRDWVTNVGDTHYLLGSALGPHPYPLMVRNFQSVIGREAREQILEMEGRLPDSLIACVGGGSNSIGLFHPFLADRGVSMTGVEAGGSGHGLGEHAARFNEMSGGKIGVLQGTKSYILQDEGGQVASTHSVSAGLDYASIGPEHAYLHDTGRISYTSASDSEALDAFHTLSRTEGIIPALETAHAVAYAMKAASEMASDRLIIVNLSGRGDKDVNTVAEAGRGSIEGGGA